MSDNSFDARATLAAGGREHVIYSVGALQPQFDVARLPFSLKILLENLLRTEDGVSVSKADIENLARWDAAAQPSMEIAFSPARVLMQDFTGVPAVVDLAAMRDAMADMDGDPRKINPLVPAELVIDHSVQVDAFGSREAFARNAELEFHRNQERYAFLRWGQGAFEGFKVVPPDTGIVHQVNLEYLARVVFANDETGEAYPDTLVGTDSHTTLVNGLGVLGWGVGGIEAEAAMLGQPMSMLIPQVLGVKLHGKLPEGATATDLVLTVTQRLRERGVVGMFVEFYGPGVGNVPLADRATIGNMSPEYGSTCAIFPIDEETLRYLRFSGRPTQRLELVEAYARTQGLFHDPDEPQPTYSDTIELDLGAVVPSLAGPKRPQDRVSLTEAKAAFRMALESYVDADGQDGVDSDEESFPASDPPASSSPSNGDGAREPGGGGAGGGDAGGGDAGGRAAGGRAAGGRAAGGRAAGGRDAGGRAAGGRAAGGRAAGGGTGGLQMAERASARVPVTLADGTETELDHGHVVIAAITSCTNTSNPSVMLSAGLLARNAVQRGLTSKPWVKTSLAPGSKVVMDYYAKAGLVPYLEKLGFHLVGYGCTTCIGNSGPLPEEVSSVVQAQDLSVVSVLSGNRNFEGRINPDIKMNYLASPPLVIAYALAGTMDWDPQSDPIGTSEDGTEVFLADIWPAAAEVARVVEASISTDMFTSDYADVFAGDERWRSLPTPSGQTFDWAPESTYVRRPPYFEGMALQPAPVQDVSGARVLAKLGDSVTTDHISPAGSIRADSPAGRYLTEHGVDKRDFNSYGSRRGNHEVMIRGTFANIRLRNQLLDGVQGGFTADFTKEGAQATIYDAAQSYAAQGIPLVVLAGKEYGSGSSRDWAAKGTRLLGVRVVIAQSYERIHRSNLIGMGVLPLQYPEGQDAASLGLDGTESFDVRGITAINEGRTPATVQVSATKPAGGSTMFEAVVRLDTPGEADYYRGGGILQYVVRSLVR